jgi:hypothetical protein
MPSKFSDDRLKTPIIIIITIIIIRKYYNNIIIVFSTTGGMGKETAVAYKHLAELLAEKRKSEYGISLWPGCDAYYRLP